MPDAPEVVETPAEVPEPTIPVVDAPTTPPEPEAPEVDYSALPEGDTIERGWAEGLHTRYASAQEAVDKLTGWGGTDAVAEAVEFRQRYDIKSVDGVTKLFIDAGQALGLGFKDLNAVLEATKEPAPEPQGLDALEDDDVLTVGQMREYLAQKVLEPQAQTEASQKAAHEKQVQDTAKVTVTRTLAELGLTDKQEIDQVFTLGQAHLADDDWDPEHIADAIRKGKADWDAQVQKHAEAYLAKKTKATEEVPTSIGAANIPGGSDLPEPQSVAEAIALNRKRRG